MNYPIIDPEIVSLGFVSIRWYGVMYLVGFLLCYLLGGYRARIPKSGWTKEEVYDMVFYGVVGTIAGGRIGFAVFYGFDSLVNAPLWIFKVWLGGMSFHGGLLGVLVALWLFARKMNKPFFDVTDFIAPLVPLGLGLGRIGNFINAELPGRLTDTPFGVHFPCDAVFGLTTTCIGSWEQVTRHVSSLYQAFGEGIVLFGLVWLFSGRKRNLGMVSGMFLLGYGVIRLFTEQFRQPDPGLDFVAFGWLTMGQFLSLPMIILGICLLIPGTNKFIVEMRK